MDHEAALAAYDVHVRQNTRPDGTGAVFESDGRVVRRIAPAGQGGCCVIWSALDQACADAVIAEQVAALSSRAGPLEWKLFSYDLPPDLPSRLSAAGFIAQEPESLMIAEAREVLSILAGAAPPAGVELRRVTGPEGVDLVARVHEMVFGADESALRASLLSQLAGDPGATDLVVALAGEEPVSAGRIEFVPGTMFAGLWGGGTLPGWRRRGIYRALVRDRAEIAVQKDSQYLTVDASEQSRPILERAGFTCVATTTPYLWSPGEDR